MTVQHPAVVSVQSAKSVNVLCPYAFECYVCVSDVSQSASDFLCVLLRLSLVGRCEIDSAHADRPNVRAYLFSSKSVLSDLRALISCVVMQSNRKSVANITTLIAMRTEGKCNRLKKFSERISSVANCLVMDTTKTACRAH